MESAIILSKLHKLLVVISEILTQLSRLHQLCERRIIRNFPLYRARVYDAVGDARSARHERGALYQQPAVQRRGDPL